METGKIIKGSLSAIILQLLENNGAMYGYEMTKAVRQGSMEKMKVTEAALYPALHKLEESGMLETEIKFVEGRQRKYYRLSENGKAEGRRQLEHLQEMIASLQQVLDFRLQKS
ncbi:PadR family transcriptional regulator [Rurimicrobium arvi]|uniref:Transcription regulator PadR N-terminal domain-containing protein n=1 Tax=Rurimicrobium arvi TaxID=2049916 RepID=A0ABP8MMV1_9BACT